MFRTGGGEGPQPLQLFLQHGILGAQQFQLELGIVRCEVATGGLALFVLLSRRRCCCCLFGKLQPLFLHTLWHPPYQTPKTREIQ